MLRHYDVAAYDKLIPRAHRLKRPLEEAARRRRAKVWEPTVAAKRDEVEACGLVVSD